MKKTCTFVAALLLAGCAGCGEEEKPVEPPAPPPVEQPKPAPKQAPVAKPKAPPLTAEQSAGVKKAFDEARAMVKQADDLKAKGDQLVKTGGAAAANDTYVQAKELYHKAVEMVSDWTDGDLGGKVSDAQIKDYLGDYVAELSRWQKSMSELGKIHKDN